MASKAGGWRSAAFLALAASTGACSLLAGVDDHTRAVPDGSTTVIVVVADSGEVRSDAGDPGAVDAGADAERPIRTDLRVRGSFLVAADPVAAEAGAADAGPRARLRDQTMQVAGSCRKFPNDAGGQCFRGGMVP